MKILLIRLRLIGDVVFTTPIPRALKRRFPDARIAYLVEKEAAPVVAGNPHIDELIIVERLRGWRRIVADVKLAAALRRRRFDLVLDLHGGPRSSWLTRATGARQRIGYTIRGRGWMYTKTAARPRELRPRHSVVNQWDLLHAIDGWSGEPDPLCDAVEMQADPAADARIAARLAAAGISNDDEIIVVHVSAGNPFRRWPEPAFVELVTALARGNERRRLILSSGPSDTPAADRIVDAARAALGREGSGRVIEFGEFGLAEMRSLVARSRLFVGGDTGPLHVAATTATPVVAVFGPTLPSRSVPWRDPRVPTEVVEVTGLACRPCDQRVCEPGDFRCLTTLKPAEVITAAERALSAPTT